MAFIPQVMVEMEHDISMKFIFPSHFTPHVRGLGQSVVVRRVGTWRTWTLRVHQGVGDDGQTPTVELPGVRWIEFCYDNDIRKGDRVLFQYPGNDILILRVLNHKGIAKVITPGPKPYVCGGVGKPRVVAILRAELETGVDTYVGCSPHPAFKILINPQYAISGFANIPFGWAKRFFYPDGIQPRQKEVLLRAPHAGPDAVWPVTVNTYFKRDSGEGYNAKFCNGWIDFVKGAGIVAGNVCTFEMIRDDPKVEFKVIRFAM